MINIYNIIAEVCSDIISENDETMFIEYSCISSNTRSKMYFRIFQVLPILFEGENSIVHALNSNEITLNFCSDLNDLISTLRSEKDYFTMLALLQIIDEAVRDLLLDKIKEFCEDDFSVVLNTNRETTGIGLLPRCSCVWERSNRLAHSYNRLDNFLFNILLLENSILGDLIDKHYFLKQNVFADFAENKELQIAVSPLSDESPFKKVYYEESGVNYFKASYEKTSFSKDNEIIWDKIMSATENKSDIIVFPELMGNPDTVNVISRRLSRMSRGEQLKLPSLIILPSVFENKLNTVTVLTSSGEVLCKQSKQNPYREEHSDGSYLEAICTNNVVNILHYEGIGRIAVLICKDFITTKYMEQLIRCFKLTLIIVPSYSTGSYDFRQSFDLCAHDDCNVVWINACAAFEEGKESNFKNIGYVRKRIGRNDDESQKLCEMPICSKAFKDECPHDCIYFESVKGV